MEAQLFDKMRLASTLVKIGHGNFNIYVNDAMPAAVNDPGLFAHFVAWNHINSKIRDNKVAFPVVALRGSSGINELSENAIAHLVSLGPRELIKAYEFSKQLTQKGHNVPGGQRKKLQNAIQRYLLIRERNEKWWDSSVLSNRKAMKGLYAVSHKRPTERVQKILFEKKYPTNSVFHALKNLKNMNQLQAAGAIERFKIPAPVAIGAVSNISTSVPVLMAIIDRMSANELMNNAKMLEAKHVFDISELRAAFDLAVERAKTDKRTNVYKATKAKSSIGSGKVAAKIMTIQETHEKKLGGIGGDWLVLADRSSSMSTSIEASRHIAATLVSQAKGKVILVFFSSQPILFDVTGLTYDQILEKTKDVYAGGCTSIGCGLEYLQSKGTMVEGIAIVSDGGDNSSPYFHNAYASYSKKMGIDPSVYLFHVPGDPNKLSTYCERNGIEIEIFELGRDVDYYALPNLVKTLRVSRFELFDEIMQTPLLTLEQVFKGKGGF